MQYIDIYTRKRDGSVALHQSIPMSEYNPKVHKAVNGIPYEVSEAPENAVSVSENSNEDRSPQELVDMLKEDGLKNASTNWKPETLKSHAKKRGLI